MKTTVKIIVATLVIISLTTCKKEPYYNENVDFYTLLNSNKWEMTKFTVIERIDGKTTKHDAFDFYRKWFSDSQVRCVENFNYIFDLENQIYYILNCNKDTLVTEKSLDLKYYAEKKYKWEIMFDSTIMLTEFSVYKDSLFYTNNIYWKVDYYQKDEFKVSRTYYSIDNSSDSMYYSRIYKIAD